MQPETESTRVGSATGAWRRRLHGYVLSLPERVLRSVSALAGGVLNELGDAVLPAAVRRTRLYRTLVEASLRFLIENVGEAEGVFPAEGKVTEDFLLRRTAGNGIELAGILAFHASPVWVLAALADLSGAGRHLVREISTALKEEGLLGPETEFSTVDELLNGLEQGAGRLAESVNTPPLNVAGLRQEWNAIRAEFAKIPAALRPRPDAVRDTWNALQVTASEEHRSVFEVSSAVALGAVNQIPEGARWLSRSAVLAARRSGQIFASAILDHYNDTLREIRTTGYWRYLAREFRPYLRAALLQFTPDKESFTERMLRRPTRGTGGQRTGAS